MCENHEMEQKQWELKRDFYFESLKTTIAYAAGGMKALFMVSGGAAVAMLAFIGHLVTLQKTGVTIRPFVDALGWYFFASLLGSAAFLMSYLSQFFHTGTIFTEETSRFGHVFHGLAVLVVVASYVSCLWGMFVAYKAFLSF